MHKLLASIKKEIQLLTRDWGGLGILFLMPSVLLVTITLIQESTFQAVGESVMPVVLVDHDNGEIGKTVEEHFSKSHSTELITEYKGKKIDENDARKLVSEGKYQIALVIP
jgi:ABC-2 type transport system permease protein